MWLHNSRDLNEEIKEGMKNNFEKSAGQLSAAPNQSQSGNFGKQNKYFF